MPQLRPYHSDDFEQLIQLFLLNTPQYFCPPEQQDLEEYLRTEIEHYSVIEEDGVIVASGGCNLIEDGIGCLSWYIVHPAYQGKGFGKQLAEHNLDILKSLPEVSRITVRTSQLVFPFYEKSGFKLISTTDNYWGEGMHLYEMELPYIKH